MRWATEEGKRSPTVGSARRIGPILLGALTVLMAAACGRQAVVRSGPGAASHTVDVRLSEYHIDMPMAVTAGEVSFRVRNDGNLPHRFEIEGEGVERSLGGELGPGETRTLTVELRPGSYDIFCPVADHERRGMFRRLTATRG